MRRCCSLSISMKLMGRGCECGGLGINVGAETKGMLSLNMKLNANVSARVASNRPKIRSGLTFEW
jgi:hypothetical protein